MKSRRVVIDRKLAGRTIADVLRQHFKLTRPQALALLRKKQIRHNGKPCQNLNRQVRVEERLEIDVTDKKPAQASVQSLKGRSHQGAHAPRSPGHVPRTRSPWLDKIIVRYLDEQIIVVDKPAGLTTVRHAEETAKFGKRVQRFLPETLVDLLPALLPTNERRGRIRAVHRLDKETSGLVVLARTPEAESRLGVQFREHSIERRYVALVRGRAKRERIESFLVRDRGDGRRGSGADNLGQRAVTEVSILEELGDFTLIECRLETGRTHQVRIHLGERGTPLCGERIYDRAVHGSPLPDASAAARPLLHAAYLAIDHPAFGERMEWASEVPDDMQSLLQRLRKTRAANQ
ncbi:MAG: pseudouridine synthase [Gemmataceae bacterium]|nr:pseudouridine synthase [Gemmataceae bacterium]MCI0739241.1 pseudouridine synthase [Gemmataceae bacterium]